MPQYGLRTLKHCSKYTITNHNLDFDLLNLSNLNGDISCEGGRSKANSVNIFPTAGLSLNPWPAVGESVTKLTWTTEWFNQLSLAALCIRQHKFIGFPSYSRGKMLATGWLLDIKKYSIYIYIAILPLWAINDHLSIQSTTKLLHMLKLVLS